MELRLPLFSQKGGPELFDRFFYLPPYYEQHELHTFSLFPPSRGIFVEYCSGNGQWILERAKKDSSIFWVAIEKKWERVVRIWQKMKKANLCNLLVVYGEAYVFTRNYLPETVAQEIFVNFPDPWPKRCHHKHRLIRKEFVQELARIGKKGGKITLVSDDPDYSEIMRQEMLSSQFFHPLSPYPHYVTELPEYGSSTFEELWRKKGRCIRYLQFINQK